MNTISPAAIRFKGPPEPGDVGFASGRAGPPVTIHGVTAQPLNVRPEVQKAQSALYASPSSWGGDQNQVAALRFNPKDVQAAMKTDAGLKRFLLEAAVQGALGTSADNSILDSNGKFDPSNTTLVPYHRGEGFSVLEDWMKQDGTKPDQLKQYAPSIRQLAGALEADPNVKLYKLESYLPGTDDDAAAMIAVNAKTGEVNMLSSYYAAG